MDNDTKVDLIKKVKEIEKKEEAKFRHDIHPEIKEEEEEEAVQPEQVKEEQAEQPEEVKEEVVEEVVEEEVVEEGVKEEQAEQPEKVVEEEGGKVEVIINIKDPEEEFLDGIEDKKD